MMNDMRKGYNSVSQCQTCYDKYDCLVCYSSTISLPSCSSAQVIPIELSISQSGGSQVMAGIIPARQRGKVEQLFYLNMSLTETDSDTPHRVSAFIPTVLSGFPP